MRPLLKAIDDPPTPVTCGACPVNMRCAVERGGTGWTYGCCQSTSLAWATKGRHDLVIVDCGRHRFEQAQAAKECSSCPLCDGEIVRLAIEAAELLRVALIYVPTAYARVPIADRLSLWRRLLAQYGAKEAP